MSTGMRKWMEKDCPDIPSLPAEVSIDREELRQLRDELAQYKNERDALRAKIEAMEKQEPVAWMCSDKALIQMGYKKFSDRCEGEWNIPVFAGIPGAQGA